MSSRRRIPAAVKLAAVVVALAAVLLAACSSASPSAPADTRPATPARLEIIAPASGAVVEPHATLRVKLSGAKLTTTPLSGGALPIDQGFVHLYVDDKLVSVLYGLTQKLPTLDAGAHTLRVEFVAADHAPFANQVVATTQFSVQP